MEKKLQWTDGKTAELSEIAERTRAEIWVNM